MEVRNAMLASALIAVLAVAVLLLPLGSLLVRVAAGIGLSLAFALSLLALLSWRWQDRLAVRSTSELPAAPALDAGGETDRAALAG